MCVCVPKVEYIKCCVYIVTVLVHLYLVSHAAFCTKHSLRKLKVAP